MNYIVELTNTADKQLEKLDQKQQDRINNSLLDLCEFYDGVSNKKPDIKPLTGKYNGLLRLRVGSYRVIFQLKGGQFVVLVIQIVKRGDAYR